MKEYERVEIMTEMGAMKRCSCELDAKKWKAQRAEFEIDRNLGHHTRPSTTESFFGIVISAYSLAQIIASPLLGYWSNCIRQLKAPLMFCAAFMFVGNIMYFVVEIFPSHHKYYLLFARFITGIGASTIGLLKAYASAASVSKDRSRAIAFVTGGMALGTTFGPAFQVFFSWIGYPGWNLTSGFRLTMFNAPALLACAMNILTLLLLCFFFKESFAGIADSEAHKVKKKETVGSSFAMMMFAWDPAEVVRYSSLAHAGKGFLAFIVYFVYIVFNLGKKLNERMVCLVSLVGLLAFHAFTFSWPFCQTNPSNSSQAVGCDFRNYSWCYSLKQVNMFVYFFFYVLIVGIAFPNINVTMNTLFSRIIGPRMQGTQQGLLQMSGGTARMAGPLLVGYLYTQQGPRLV
uniref:Major facilitator superfamily (MFS) profile domain-containing protein n=1 Tax=Ditylenchus dipsaci TaxID=166011 RepID=A0A915D1K5_9BILA